MGPRAREVDAPQDLVERAALREGEHVVVEARAEPTRPEGHVVAPGRSSPTPWRCRPGLDAESPQPDEPLGVGVAERVGRVVGGEAVVVQGDGAAPADDAQDPGGGHLQAHLARDVSLGLLDERVERALERREPHAVVDELGPPRLEPRLLVVDVALQA